MGGKEKGTITRKEKSRNTDRFWRSSLPVNRGTGSILRGGGEKEKLRLLLGLLRRLCGGGGEGDA